MHQATLRNNPYAWVVLVTALVLLVPLLAMQFTDQVNWDVTDFIVMAVLMLGMGSLFVLVSTRRSRRSRMVIGALFIAAFLYMWAELAVGIFTHLGS